MLGTKKEMQAEHKLIILGKLIYGAAHYISQIQIEIQVKIQIEMRIEIPIEIQIQIQKQKQMQGEHKLIILGKLIYPSLRRNNTHSG